MSGLFCTAAGRFSVYPDPSVNTVTIKANECRFGSGYYIKDITGRRVALGKLDNETTDINISYLTRGIYMVGLVDQRERPVKMIKL